MTQTRLALAALVAAALITTGCGEKGTAGDSAEMRLTRDFGSERVAGTTTESKIPKNETVLSFLKNHHKVSSVGDAVLSIDGVGATDTKRWSYYINGTQPDDPPGKVKLNPGDVVQWDYHDAARLPAMQSIVGSYPEPFVHGFGGRKLPARIECTDAGSAACKEVQQRLAGDGIIVSSSALGVSQRGAVLSIFVGPWSKVRGIRAAQKLEQDPTESGVYAKFTGAGRGLDLLGVHAETVKSLGPGAGLVAAIQLGAGDGVTWIVSGVDDAGTDAAAKLMDATRLRDAFALAALPDGGDERLPVTP